MPLFILKSLDGLSGFYSVGVAILDFGFWISWEQKLFQRIGIQLGYQFSIVNSQYRLGPSFLNFASLRLCERLLRHYEEKIP